MSRNLDYAKIARHPSQSAAPELWPSHAWVPAFGPTGATLFNLCSAKHGTISGASWTPRGLYFGNSTSDQVDCGAPVLFSTLRAFTFSISYITPADTKTVIIAENGTVWSTNSFMVTHNETFYKPQFSIANPQNQYQYIRSTLTYPILSNVTLVAVWTSGSPLKLAINGFLDSGELAGLDKTQVKDGDANWVLGKRPGSTLYAFDQTILQNSFWPYALTDSQAITLSLDPYLPFRRRVPVFYSVPSAGGGSYSLTLDGSSYAISGTASQLLKLSVCSATTASYEKLGTAVSLLRLLKIIGASESYAITGTELSFLRSLNLSGLSGSYEVQGVANSLLRQLVLSAGLMSYALSGTDAALSAVGDSSLVVDSGGYEISGTTAALLRTLLLSAATSSYTKSGTAATLLRALSLGAAGSDYALSGTAADLIAPPGSYILDASWSGAQYWRDTEGNPILDTEGNPILIYDDLYKIIPKAAELLRSYPLSAGTESYSVNGTVSDLLKLAKLISNSGAYNYSGKSISGGYQKLFAAAGTTYEQSGTDIDLSRTRNLAALTGSYSLFGTAVRFIPTIFMVGSGSYNLLGTQISTILSHVLPGTGGEYVLTGTDNPLYYGFFITPQSGSYLSVGVDADLRMFSGLSSYGGSYLVSGSVSDLKFLHRLGLGSSQYDITGTDPDVLAVRALTLGSDSYSITGEDIAFDAFYLSTLGGGSYLLNGVPITFGSDYILYARPGTINYSGQIVLLWYSAEIIGNVLMFLDIKTAEIILAVKSPQLTLEFNERN